MTEAKIAQAGTDDAEMLSAVHGCCLSPAWDAATFRTFLGRPSGFAVMASGASKAQPVGFCLGTMAADEVEVLSLCVLPDQRRCGVARRLMRTFQELAWQRGGRVVFLEVAHDNTAAIALYSLLGYVETARRRGYYAATATTPARDGIVMRQQLSQVPNGAPVGLQNC